MGCIPALTLDLNDEQGKCFLFDDEDEDELLIGFGFVIAMRHTGIKCTQYVFPSFYVLYSTSLTTLLLISLKLYARNRWSTVSLRYL